MPNGQDAISEHSHPRFWKFYRTPGGAREAFDYIMSRPEKDRAKIVAAMEDVVTYGKEASRHVRDDVYEVRVSGKDVTYRIFYATEGRYNQVLLAVHAVAKKTQKARDHDIDEAMRRLKDWRSRAKPGK